MSLLTLFTRPKPPPYKVADAISYERLVIDAAVQIFAHNETMSFLDAWKQAQALIGSMPSSLDAGVIYVH